MSRPRPHPMAHNRAVYQTLMDRIDYLGTLGPICQQIIDDLRKADIIRRPIKGLNPYRLEEHVVICSDRIFRAEKRIIREASPEEWDDDSRLQAISDVLQLREFAHKHNFEVEMKPNHFSIKLHYIKIDTEYDGDQIAECAQLLEAYNKTVIKPDSGPASEQTTMRHDSKSLADCVQSLGDCIRN